MHTYIHTYINHVIRSLPVVICDESHYLKNPKAVRTSTIVPFIKNSKRAMLLSGKCMYSPVFMMCR